MPGFASRGAAMRHILFCYHDLNLSRFGSPAYVRLYRGTFFLIPFGAHARHEYTFRVLPLGFSQLSPLPEWTFEVYCSGPLALPWGYD